MNGEEIVTLAVMLLTCGGCGVLFFCIGIRAERSGKPFGFWAGQEVSQDSVSDIPAYNRESGRMWKIYSVPYFLSCGLYLSGVLIPVMEYLAMAVLILAGTLGIGLLIGRYKHIRGKYSVK